MRAPLFLLGLAACADHFTVPPIPPNASPEYRLETWRRWHSRGHADEVRVSCDGRGTCTRTEVPALELEAGVKVRDAEDLRPLIPDDSKAGAALRGIERAKSSRTTWVAVAVAGAVVGLAGVIGSDQTGNANWFYYGGGIGVVGAFVGSIGVYAKNLEITEASREVFRNYDAALAQRLQLCVQGLALVPCEAQAPGTPSVPLPRN